MSFIVFYTEDEPALCKNVGKSRCLSLLGCTKFAPDWKINKVDFTLKSLYFFLTIEYIIPKLLQASVLWPVYMKVGDPR